MKKTPQTYQLCVELDGIGDENEFYENVIKKNCSTEEFDSLLETLMREYEKRTFGLVSSVWDSIQQNKDKILEERLFLKVENFVTE